MWGMKSTTIFLFAIASAAPLVTACSGDVFEGDDLLGGDAGGDALSKPDAAGGDAGNGDAVATGDGDPSGDASDGSVQAEAEAGCPVAPFTDIDTCSKPEVTCLRQTSVTCETSNNACFDNGNYVDGGVAVLCGQRSDCPTTGHCCLMEGATGIKGCPNVITVYPGSAATFCDTGCGSTQVEFSDGEVCATNADCSGGETCEFSVLSYGGGEFEHLGVCH